MTQVDGLRGRATAAFWAVLPLALMLAGVKIFWRDVPWGVTVDGVVQGLLTALIALGIVIVYRANRIVNFAAADLGAVPATLTLLLFASVGWNLYLAIATGFGAAIVLGVLVEFLFLRRFFTAPRLILTVATIGVTQVLVFLGRRFVLLGRGRFRVPGRGGRGRLLGLLAAPTASSASASALLRRRFGVLRRRPFLAARTYRSQAVAGRVRDQRDRELPVDPLHGATAESIRRRARRVRHFGRRQRGHRLCRTLRRLKGCDGNAGTRMGQ